LFDTAFTRAEQARETLEELIKAHEAIEKVLNALMGGISHRSVLRIEVAVPPVCCPDVQSSSPHSREQPMIIPAEAEILLALQYAKQYERSLAKARDTGRCIIAGSSKIPSVLDLMPKGGGESKCQFGVFHVLLSRTDAELVI
jgi:hypothetical protein